jgi:hypothetical protein
MAPTWGGFLRILTIGGQDSTAPSGLEKSALGSLGSKRSQGLGGLPFSEWGGRTWQ